MSSVIVAGVLLIHTALIFYTIFIFKEHKYKRATNGLLFFITLAVTFDISATVCMMIGAGTGAGSISPPAKLMPLNATTDTNDTVIFFILKPLVFVIISIIALNPSTIFHNRTISSKLQLRLTPIDIGRTSGIYN